MPGVRIIALSTLKAFWVSRPEFQDAQEPTLAWYRDALQADWAPPAAVKAQFGTASILRDGRVVFNLGGKYYAIEDVCTHDGGQLTGGVVEGGEIVCPRHGARFCIRTGEALTAPAYEPVARLPVRVENGVIQVRDNRWD